VPMSTKPSRDVFIPALTVFFAISSRRRPSRRRLSRRRTNARMRGGPGTEPDGHYCLHIVPRVMTGDMDTILARAHPRDRRLDRSRASGVGDSTTGRDSSNRHPRPEITIARAKSAAPPIAIESLGGES
jgi:hypothetical protein